MTKRTTAPPRKDLLDVLPELAGQTILTVRLHPRRGTAPSTTSKVGGLFLWPADEPWPSCNVGHPDWLNNTWAVPPGTPITAVPILQLYAHDFPELQFYPETNLFQLLWCPHEHRDTFDKRPMVFWRNSEMIKNPLREIPPSPLAYYQSIPHECRISPERVLEYPNIQRLPEALQSRLEQWDISDITPEDEDPEPLTLYEWELSVCPGSKIGGEVFWVQRAKVPVCQCGQSMEHLLTISGNEFDTGTFQRWLPLEDRQAWMDENPKLEEIRSPLGVWMGRSGKLYLFICHRCEGWPTEVVIL